MPLWCYVLLTVAAGFLFLLRSPQEAWTCHLSFRILGLFCLAMLFWFFPTGNTSNFVRNLGFTLALLVLVVGLLDFAGSVTSKWMAAFREKRGLTKLPSYIHEIGQALERMAQKKMGSLIVLERKTRLDPFLKAAGISLDAEIKADVLIALFATTSPVHDGAVLIRKGRIATVKAVLPLVTDDHLPAGYGTRHRSALGITEHTDAIALVSSEERGIISLVYEGRLFNPNGIRELEKLLKATLKGKLPPEKIKKD